MVFIYILKLKSNKYYVGKTEDPDLRLLAHQNNSGSMWTKKYKPIKVIELFEGDKYDEDKYVHKYMDKYGIENVRGGSYSSIKLRKDQLNNLKHINKSQNDRCFKCGRKGHFASNCHYKKNKEFLEASNCYESADEVEFYSSDEESEDEESEDEESEDEDNVNVEISEKVELLNNFETRKAKIIIKDDKDEELKMNIWFTEKTLKAPIIELTRKKLKNMFNGSIPPSLGFNEMNIPFEEYNINKDAVNVRFETINKNGTFTYSLLEYSSKDLLPDMFEIPKNYKKVKKL